VTHCRNKTKTAEKNKRKELNRNWLSSHTSAFLTYENFVFLVVVCTKIKISFNLLPALNAWL
jgi:hypothetical protein